MTEDLSRDSGRPPGEAGGPRQRFAALITAGRAAILASYGKSLEASDSPAVAEPVARAQIMTGCSEMISDVLTSVQAGDIRIGNHRAMLAWMADEAGTCSQLSPAELARAAGTFFDVAVGFLAGYVEDDPGLLPCFLTAVRALNESICCRIRETTLASTGYLLERVDQAHIGERRRMARDLHDWLGEGLSVALRQLELHEIAGREDPDTSPARTAMAKQTLTETMRRLRLVISGLRNDPVRNLECALVGYLDSVSAEAEVRLRVSGDETWAPPVVIDEAFLIVREAIRNALTHGAPRVLLIGIALAPHELLTWIEDDGIGFVADQGQNPATMSNGMASMHERAVLVGGRLAVTSIPGKGTHVELLVPLPGRRDEEAHRRAGHSFPGAWPGRDRLAAEPRAG